MADFKPEQPPKAELPTYFTFPGISIAAREELYRSSKTDSSAHSLAIACYNAALFLEDEELMRRAYELWDDLCGSHPEYIKYRERARL